MKYLEISIPEKVGFCLPVGDIHLGDKAFSKEGEQKLINYLKWANDHPNSRILLMGDIFNVNTRESPGSPFDQESNEFQRAIKIFEPYQEQIIGGLIGNHCKRLVNYADVNLMQMFCLALKIPYLGISAIIRFKVNKRPNSNRYRENYFAYIHHSYGGGATIGSKMNRVAKLREIVEGVDMYLSGHNHMLGAVPMDVYKPSLQGRKVERRRIWFVDTGSYLSYPDSYAEEKMLPPSKLGSPRIRMSGDKHDIHVSL